MQPNVYIYFVHKLFRTINKIMSIRVIKTLKNLSVKRVKTLTADCIIMGASRYEAHVLDFQKQFLIATNWRISYFTTD